MMAAHRPSILVEQRIVTGMLTAALLVLIAGTLTLMAENVGLGLFLVGWAVAVLMIGQWMQAGLDADEE